MTKPYNSERQSNVQIIIIISAKNEAGFYAGLTELFIADRMKSEKNNATTTLFETQF